MSIEFKTLFDESGSHEEPFQVMQTNCPECHKLVLFTLQNNDIQYRQHNEQLMLRLKIMRDEIIRLNRIIDRLLETGHV
jgi:hypothetical protein